MAINVSFDESTNTITIDNEGALFSISHPSEGLSFTNADGESLNELSIQDLKNILPTDELLSNQDLVEGLAAIALNELEHIDGAGGDRFSVDDFNTLREEYRSNIGTVYSQDDASDINALQLLSITALGSLYVQLRAFEAENRLESGTTLADFQVHQSADDTLGSVIISAANTPATELAEAAPETEAAESEVEAVEDTPAPSLSETAEDVTESLGNAFSSFSKALNAIPGFDLGTDEPEAEAVEVETEAEAVEVEAEAEAVEVETEAEAVEVEAEAEAVEVETEAEAVEVEAEAEAVEVETEAEAVEVEAEAEAVEVEAEAEAVEVEAEAEAVEVETEAEAVEAEAEAVEDVPKPRFITPDNDDALLQALLTLNGQNVGVIDGIAGNNTRSGISDYLRNNPVEGVDANNILEHLLDRLQNDPEFQTRLQNAAVNAVTQSGATETQIRSAQVVMNHLGHTDQNGNRLVVDGLTGSRSRHAGAEYIAVDYSAAAVSTAVSGQTWTYGGVVTTNDKVASILVRDGVSLDAESLNAFSSQINTLFSSGYKLTETDEAALGALYHAPARDTAEAALTAQIYQDAIRTARAASAAPVQNVTRTVVASPQRVNSDVLNDSSRVIDREAITVDAANAINRWKLENPGQNLPEAGIVSIFKEGRVDLNRTPVLIREINGETVVHQLSGDNPTILAEGFQYDPELREGIERAMERVKDRYEETGRGRRSIEVAGVKFDVTREDHGRNSASFSVTLSQARFDERDKKHTTSHVQDSHGRQTLIETKALIKAFDKHDKASHYKDDFSGADKLLRQKWADAADYAEGRLREALKNGDDVNLNVRFEGAHDGSTTAVISTSSGELARLPEAVYNSILEQAIDIGDAMDVTPTGAYQPPRA